MKAMPTDDEAFGKNHIRKDGLCLLPSFLYQVKSTAESHGMWDLQKLVATTPGDQAWKPLAEEGCPLAPPDPAWHPASATAWRCGGRSRPMRRSWPACCSRPVSC